MGAALGAPHCHPWEGCCQRGLVNIVQAALEAGPLSPSPSLSLRRVGHSELLTGLVYPQDGTPLPVRLSADTAVHR